jgi:hypothetical protein
VVVAVEDRGEPTTGLHEFVQGVVELAVDVGVSHGVRRLPLVLGRLELDGELFGRPRAVVVYLFDQVQECILGGLQDQQTGVGFALFEEVTVVESVDELRFEQGIDEPFVRSPEHDLLQAPDDFGEQVCVFWREDSEGSRFDVLAGFGGAVMAGHQELGGDAQRQLLSFHEVDELRVVRVALVVVTRNPVQRPPGDLWQPARVGLGVRAVCLDGIQNWDTQALSDREPMLTVHDKQTTVAGNDVDGIRTQPSQLLEAAFDPAEVRLIQAAVRFALFKAAVIAGLKYSLFFHML